MITVGSSGALGTGGMVITDGSSGRWWRWGGSSAGPRGAGDCCGGAGWGGAARDTVVVAVVLVLVVVVVVLVVVVDEVVLGVVVVPGPRLVSWMMPQITTAIIPTMSAIQAISTGRLRNHGVGGDPPKSAGTAGSGAGCCPSSL
ncbi:MAG: hypothetical protein ABI307_10100 [Mycobacterium sp.]